MLNREQKRARRAARQKVSDTRVADACKISVGGVNEQKKV